MRRGKTNGGNGGRRPARGNDARGKRTIARADRPALALSSIQAGGKVPLKMALKSGRKPAARPEREAIVVKLGGSLGEGSELKRWARIVARASRPVVVVPGGGAFADAVRQMQGRHRFCDAAAHRMAILAMHQTALMLIALEPRLVPAETVAEMRAAWAGARIPVWLPLRMVDRDRAIPANWSVTSDGLAARLAERLGAAAVCLIKSRCTARAATAAQLAGDGIVDQQFPVIVGRGDLVWRLLGPGEERQLARVLRVPASPSAAGHRRARRAATT